MHTALIKTWSIKSVNKHASHYYYFLLCVKKVFIQQNRRQCYGLQNLIYFPKIGQTNLIKKILYLYYTENNASMSPFIIVFLVGVSCFLSILFNDYFFILCKTKYKKCKPHCPLKI